MKNTTQQPLKGNGLVQMMREGNSFRHKWVKYWKISSKYILLLVLIAYAKKPPLNANHAGRIQGGKNSHIFLDMLYIH